MMRACTKTPSKKDSNLYRTIFAALLLSASISPAMAQSQDLYRQLLANFDRVDVNDDGVISLAEYRKIQIARWPQIDRNGDGHLTLDDFPRIAAGRVRTQLAQVAYLDTDSDGRISRSEFINGQPLLFRRADRNADNALTRSELEAATSQN